MTSERVEVSLDMRHRLDHEKKMGVYTHNVVAFHNDTADVFTFTNLSYTFNCGFGFSANLIGDLRSFYSSMGVHFVKSINHFSIFFLTAYAINTARLNENFLIVTYKHPFSKRMNLVLQNEFYTSLRKWSHDTSFECVKLGIELHKTQIGFLKEIAQEGAKSKASTINYGGYLKQSF